MSYGLSRLDAAQPARSASLEMFNDVRILALLALLMFTSCGEKSQPAASKEKEPQTFSVKGIVKELKPDGRSVVIQHEEITNYMEAMTMPFRVRDTNELSRLKAGDEIRFRLLVTEDASWIDQVTRTGLKAAVTNASTEAAATNSPPPEFRLSHIPEFALTNEFARPVRFKDFEGRAVALTFFFTRCPIPEYCPRLTKNFQGAIEKLKALSEGPTNFHFLSVSFDPIDIPPILRAYGKQYNYDSNHWSFITGKPEDVRELARGFGIPIKAESGTYDHGFRTAIFDATGRLQVMWPVGGDMTDTIVTEIVKGAKLRE